MTYEEFLESIGVTQELMDELTPLQPEAKTESNPDYYVADSSIHGKGVFAKRLMAGRIGKFKVASDVYTLGKYTNHSDKPNCFVVRSGDIIYLHGRADKDEELTVDYSQVKEVYDEGLGYQVVDNFCEHIDLVIESAHASGFGTWLPNKGQVGSSVYEGMNFWGHHALMLRSLVRDVRSMLVPNSMFFRSTNEGMEQAYIHSDRETGDHTCVVYLSEHDEPSGTAFYKHIPTGLTCMPSFEEMKELGIFEQLKEDMVSRDPSKWEQIAVVEGKYNRALIFDAPLFHSRFPLEGIGHDESDGRLVWVTHFYKLNGYGELH